MRNAKVSRVFAIALTALIAVSIVSVGLVNAAFPPIGATVQLNPYESNPNPYQSSHIARGAPYTSSPTARAVYSITVTSPWLAHDRDLTTNAYFLYNKGTAASPGYLELKTFTKDTVLAPPIAANGVTMKMKFAAQAGTDDLYRITYYVLTSGPYELRGWTSAETLLDTYTWTPTRTWTWTNVGDIRFRIETQLVGTSDGKRIDVYEMWLTVTVDPESSEPYISLGGPSPPNPPHGYHDGDLFAIAPTEFYYYYNGYFEINSFLNTPSVEFPIGWVDFKISYAAKASTDDQYRIVYYVGDAGPVVLQDWVSGLSAQFRWPGVDPTVVSGAGTQSQRTWSNMPEPTDGVWDWIDISMVRIRVETALVGNEDFAKISLYEVWLTVYEGTFPPAGPGLSAQPPTIAPLGQDDYFFVDIYVTDVTKMHGFQYIIYYDTTVLTAKDFWSYNPFALAAPSGIDDVAGWVSVAFSSFMGDGTGFTGDTPAVRIYFTVDNPVGTASPYFETVVMSDVYGDAITPIYVTGFAYGAVPEFPFGLSAVMLLAPLIPLAYIWRTRRRVIKQ